MLIFNDYEMQRYLFFFLSNPFLSEVLDFFSDQSLVLPLIDNIDTKCCEPSGKSIFQMERLTKAET